MRREKLDPHRSGMMLYPSGCPFLKPQIFQTSDFKKQSQAFRQNGGTPDFEDWEAVHNDAGLISLIPV